MTGGTASSLMQSGRSITNSTRDLAALENGWFVPDPSPWLRITAKDASGKRAWTNPIWRDEL